MSPWEFSVAILATFTLVATKAFQNLNIVKGHPWRVPPTGLALALAEVYVVVLMADRGVGWIILPVWIGGTCGCLFSMRFHQWITKRYSKMTGYNLPDDWGSYRSRCPECGGWNHASGAETCACHEEDPIELLEEASKCLLRKAIAHLDNKDLEAHERLMLATAAIDELQELLDREAV